MNVAVQCRLDYLSKKDCGVTKFACCRGLIGSLHCATVNTTKVILYYKSPNMQLDSSERIYDLAAWEDLHSDCSQGLSFSRYPVHLQHHIRIYRAHHHKWSFL